MHLPSFLPAVFRLLACWFIGACTACAAAPSGPAADDRPVEDAARAGLQSRASAALPTLWIIGDSTVKVGTPGQRGWGEEIAPYFDAAKLNVVNRAIGGRSSRTFITEGRWAGILDELRPGDIVLMQFGHNDASPVNEDPPVTASTRARGTLRNNSDDSVDVINILTGQPETVRSFGWYIRHYIATAREKGAAVIVCSPIPRKSWSPEGKVNRGAGGFATWAREAAAQGGASFIELNEIIARGYESLGPAAVDAHFADRGTHTSPKGAAFNARAVVSGLKGLGAQNPLAPYFSATAREVRAFTL